MDFVTLEQTLAGIAARVGVPEAILEHPDLVESFKHAEAAAILHQKFHNVPRKRPRWMKLHDTTGKPALSEAAAIDGMKMIEYVAGWYKRQVKFHAEAAPFWSREGIDAKQELASTAHYRKYPSGKLARAHSIGFERAALIGYLDDPRVGIAHRLRGSKVRSDAPSSLERASRRGASPIADGNAADNESATKLRVAPKLRLPNKTDGWTKAIAATYEIMWRETGLTPSGLEVWLRMHHNPPANYPIEATRDRGLPAIAMPGQKLLTRDGFFKRWRRYTSAA